MTQGVISSRESGRAHCDWSPQNPLTIIAHQHFGPSCSGFPFLNTPFLKIFIRDSFSVL